MLTKIFWRGAALAWMLGPTLGLAAGSGAGNVDTARLEAADSEPTATDDLLQTRRRREAIDRAMGRVEILPDR